MHAHGATWLAHAGPRLQEDTSRCLAPRPPPRPWLHRGEGQLAGVTTTRNPADRLAPPDSLLFARAPSSGHSRSRKVSTSSRSNTSRLPIRFAGHPAFAEIAHLAFGHDSSTARDSTEWNLVRVALRGSSSMYCVPAAVGEAAARVLVGSAGRLSNSVEAHELVHYSPCASPPAPRPRVRPRTRSHCGLRRRRSRAQLLRPSLSESHAMRQIWLRSRVRNRWGVRNRRETGAEAC